MSLIVTGGTAIEPIPEGTHMARCVQLIDLGTQYSQVYDKESRKVMIRWELPSETILNEEGMEVPRMIHAVYTQSLSEKATLRKMLEGWRGKRFSDEELRGFDLSVLAGLPCMVTVVHNSNGGNRYANVSAVAAIPKGMPVPEQVNESIVFDIDNPVDQAKIDCFPEFIQKMIRNSKDMGGGSEQWPPMGETEDLAF